VPRVQVVTGPAFSHVKVASYLARAIGADLVKGRFTVRRLKGTVIYVGGLGIGERNVLLMLREARDVERVAFYLVCEGRLRNVPGWLFKYPKELHVVAPSEYVKGWVEKAGLRVEKVIPHGVEWFGRPKRFNVGVLGYVAGYLKRKYPSYVFPAVERFKDRFFVITTRSNPYLKYFTPVSLHEYDERKLPDDKLLSFYDMIAFYCNLSDAEGFGLTPLEAMARGTPVIAGRFPPLTEHLPEFTLWVDVTGETYGEEWGGWLTIIHHKLSVESLLKRMEEALNMPHEKYEELSAKCIEHAMKYDAREVYSAFLEFT